MSDSERLQRYKQNIECDDKNETDNEIALRIFALLNNSKLDKYCIVDAYYYDFSVIPQKIQDIYNFYRDVYLIFGITIEGEIISKWVDRWDLDSSDEIVNGEVVKGK